MPSGVDTDTGWVESAAIKAYTTLTFHRLKPGHILHPGKQFAGKIKLFLKSVKNCIYAGGLSDLR